MPIHVPPPQLQIDFAYALEQIRSQFLQEALAEAVQSLSLEGIDRELRVSAPESELSLLASRGLRGELVFAVSSVITARPRLLGYYRLILGFSQKAFYSPQGLGLGAFKSMEERGILTESQKKRLPELCRALSRAGGELIKGIGQGRLTATLLDDLTLLTLGPQLRGGHNVKLGLLGIRNVLDAIGTIVKHTVVSRAPTVIEIRNAAKRKVLIELAPDPDIVIREQMSTASFRNVIAIEVKGGTDFSNIHNRLGEAEKSHQKARGEGYNECWTVVNVDRIDVQMAHRESPTTSRFYRLSSLVKATGEEYEDFRNRIISLTGIKTRPRK